MSRSQRDKGAEIPPRTELGPEEWRELPGFPAYEVSNYGELRRSVAAATRSAGHRPKGHLKGRVGRKYWAYKIVGPDGRKRTIWGHHAVLRAFVGERPSVDHQGAHYDGNRLNNHVSNLRWATPAENGADKARHGVHKGERNSLARLTAEQVREVRARYTGKHGEQSRLAREYGISASAMRSILTGEHWNG